MATAAKYICGYILIIIKLWRFFRQNFIKNTIDLGADIIQIDLWETWVSRSGVDVAQTIPGPRGHMFAGDFFD